MPDGMDAHQHHISSHFFFSLLFSDPDLKIEVDLAREEEEKNGRREYSYSTEVEVFLDKRVREMRQTAGANSRRGATKKREISRTLLSINLHFSVQG